MTAEGHSFSQSRGQRRKEAKRDRKGPKDTGRHRKTTEKNTLSGPSERHGNEHCRREGRLRDIEGREWNIKEWDRACRVLGSIRRRFYWLGLISIFSSKYHSISLSQPGFFAALTLEGNLNMAQHCVRLPETLEGQVADAMRSDGHVSVAAFLRTSVQNELKRRRVGVAQAERDVAATLEQHRRELKAVSTALKAQFALIDAFTRVMLHCIPEPSAEVHQSAKAQARERHQRLLRMASAIMKGEAQAAMAELVSHEE